MHGLTWSIPKATDDILYDQQTMEREGRNRAQQIQDQIRKDMQTDQEDRAMRIFVQATEDTMRKSAVTCDGAHYTPHPAYYGRQRPHPYRKVPPTPPTARQGRPGDEPCEALQPGIRLRQWTRQLRRLHALKGQIQAADRQDTPAKRIKCQELWNSILQSTGYKEGFS